mgnify:CR=1 FL=1
MAESSARWVSNSGSGVSALIDNKTVAVGNERLMEQLGVSYRHCHHEGTAVHIAIDNEYAGHILIADIQQFLLE